jgi:L-fuconolactonase
MERRDFLTTGLGALAAGALGAEAEPALDVVDAHVHFWDPARLDYAWIRGSPVLSGPHLPADLWRAAEGLPVKQVVFVQAECRRDQAMEEADWVNSLAAADPRIAALVPFAPMDDEAALPGVLERLASRPRVRGIRHLLQGEKDDAFCLRPAFVSGVKRLASLNLVFELGVRAAQLPAATRLARECPGVSFVLNHIGAAPIRERKLEPWLGHLTALAACPNVTCKISGVATRADFKTWTTEDVRPYVERTIEAFGWERVMFGSDWPVCRLATEYRRWVDTLRELTRAATWSERRALWSGTARRIYRLA